MCIASAAYARKLLIGRGLKVGRNFSCDVRGVIIDPTHCWHIEIGDNVTLAPRVHVLAHDASTYAFFGATRIGKVKIGNNVFIGASSTILPGVFIGDNVIIGAGSVVTKDLPSNSVVAGNPAQVLCSLSDFLAGYRAEMLSVPLFDDSYRHEYGVSDAKKAEMNEKMAQRIAYIGTRRSAK